MSTKSDYPASATQVAPRHRVVIIGAGFGGVQVARGLASASADVTLIDQHNYHCFQPLLYQVATAVLSPADIAWPIRHILAGQPNLTMLMARAEGVDRTARVVNTSEGPIPYDILVLATGATYAYFGHDDWAEAAPGLKNIEDATRLRRRILLAFERAETTRDEAERRQLLTFAVIGGGPTGVEMAGAIAEVARHALAPDFRNVDPRTARILLIEAGPRLLPALPENLATYAARRLESMGVEVMTGTPVTSIDAHQVALGDGTTIETATTVWAAGVKASGAGQWLGAETDRAGRCLVTPQLTLPDDPAIFVIGDTAAVKDAAGKPVPGIAPAAKQMGAYVARVIRARLAGKAEVGPFRYSHQGDLATIGRNSAVVKLGRFELTGFLGWVFWGIVHVYFLIGTRNRLAVGTTWLWNYVTNQRAARLITGDTTAGEHRPAAPVSSPS